MFEIRASANARIACGILVLGGLVSVSQTASAATEAGGDRRGLESASDARRLVARLDELDPINFFIVPVDSHLILNFVQGFTNKHWYCFVLT